MKQIIVYLLLSFACFQAAGQNPLEEQVTLWNRLYVVKKLPQIHSMGLLVENRQFVNPWRGHIFLAELNYHRKISPLGSLGIHGTYLIFTLPHDPEVSNTSRKVELRTHQSFTYRWVAAKPSLLVTRIMLEERFFRSESESEQKNGFALKYLRLRTRIKCAIPVTDRLKFIFSDEFMFQSPGDLDIGFDQNRLDAIFRYQLIPQLALDLGYLNWYQQRNTVDYLRHSIRTGVFIKI
ncbi:MAG: DUF2490 domain-containing protein [Bacteroidota bacterium]